MRLTDMGWGELFVKKIIAHDCSATYEREITLHRCVDGIHVSIQECHICQEVPVRVQHGPKVSQMAKR